MSRLYAIYFQLVYKDVSAFAVLHNLHDGPFDVLGMDEYVRSKANLSAFVNRLRTQLFDDQERSP